MNKLVAALMLLCAYAGAQPFFPPATQIETDAGVLRSKFVSPFTLKNYGGIFQVSATNAIGFFNDGTSNKQYLVFWTASETSNTFGIQTASGAGGGTNFIHLPQASNTKHGYLSSNDWQIFYSRQTGSMVLSNLVILGFTNIDTSQFSVAGGFLDAIKGMMLTNANIINFTNRGDTLLQGNTIMGTNGFVQMGDGVNPFSYTNKSIFSVFENLVYFPTPGQEIWMNNNILELTNGAVIIMGGTDNTTNKLHFNEASYIVSGVGGVDAFSGQYRFINDTSGMTSNNVARWMEVTNIANALIALRGVLTNANQFGAAGATLTIASSPSLTNVNSYAQLAIPGVTASGAPILKFIGTNGTSQLWFTQPNDWLPTNILKFTITNVAAGDVLKVQAVANNAGTYTLLITNGTDNSGASSILTNGNQFAAQADGRITIASGALLTNINAFGLSNVTWITSRSTNLDKLGTNLVADGGVGNFFTNMVAGDSSGVGQTNLVLTNMMDGQTISISVFPTNGINVNIWAGTQLAPSAWFYDGNNKLLTNSWNRIVATRQGGLTNLAVLNSGFVLTNGNNITFTTNFSASPPAISIVSSSGGIASTNANQFGANVTLTIKENAFLTNATTFGLSNKTTVVFTATNLAALGTNLVADGGVGNSFTNYLFANSSGTGQTNIVFTNMIDGQTIFAKVFVSNGVNANIWVGTVAAPSAWFPDGVTTLSSNSWNWIIATREGGSTNFQVVGQGFVLTNGANITFTTNFTANPPAIAIASSGGGGGGPFNIAQFDASTSVTNIKDGAVVTNLQFFGATTRNYGTNLENWIWLTNQIYYSPQEFNGSNGTSGINLTNNWDMSLNTFKPVTNFVGTNLVFTLLNVVKGASLISAFIGNGAYSNQVSVQATAGINIKWLNWSTNGNYDFLVRPNYSYVFQAFADRGTNVNAWVSTDDPFVPFRAWTGSVSNFNATNIAIQAGASLTNVQVGGNFAFSIASYTNLNATGTASNLASCVVPGNMLTNNGDMVRAQWFGNFQSAAANTNQFTVIFGNSTIIDTGLQTASNGTWSATVYITRTGNTSQHADGTFTWYAQGTPWASTNVNLELSQTNGINTTLFMQGSARRVGAHTNNNFRAYYDPASK